MGRYVDSLLIVSESFPTCAKLEFFLFSFHYRVIIQQVTFSIFESLFLLTLKWAVNDEIVVFRDS